MKITFWMVDGWIGGWESINNLKIINKEKGGAELEGEKYLDF